MHMYSKAANHICHTRGDSTYPKRCSLYLIIQPDTDQTGTID